MIVRTSSREQWLAERRSRLTASDAAAVLHLSPFRSRLDVWAEKIGAGEPVQETEQMRLGRLLEPAILQRYESDLGPGLTLRPNDQLCVSDDHPWLACTPDAFVLDGLRAVGLVQAKATRSVQHWDQGPPIGYQVQVAVEMAVTNLPWDDLAVLISGADYESHRVERDAAAEERILGELHEFWERFVVGRAVPPPATDADVQLWSRMVPPRRETVVTLPAQGVQLYYAWKERDAAAKVAAAEAADLKAQLLALQGEAEVGVLPGTGQAMRRTVVTVPERVSKSYTFSKFSPTKWRAR